MPSRKSNSSETQPESRRSSLRRLSSIASFQTLFARRKPANNTDNTAASSSSNLSLSLSCTASDVPGLSSAGTSNLRQEGSLTELPSHAPASRLSSNRHSYVCLPDDPIGGMPRSRTFSYLPVPVRARQPSNLSQSKSHARLPSTFTPATRLPTPPSSTRRHSHTRLASLDSKVPVMKNRMKRSDTEPLLPGPCEQPGNYGRSTAFKENITLSPIKPLPAMNASYERGAASQAKAKRQSCRSSIEEQAVSTSPALGYVNPFASHPAVLMRRENRSSQAHKSATSGVSVPQPVQRWNSQPVLTNVTNNYRNSVHGEIRQTRLLSARQAPTPTVPDTPLGWNPIKQGRAKSSSVSSSNLLQPAGEHRAQRLTGTQSPSPTPKASVLSVSCAEPSAYWAGRLCALTDRYRNEELANQLMSYSSSSKSGLTPKGQTDKMHTPEASTARVKRALDYLTEMCTTPEAKESLLQFQATYARQSGLTELAPPKPPTRTIVLGSVKDDEFGGADADAKSVSESRKTSFMDRLLGRQKRRSLALS